MTTKRRGKRTKRGRKGKAGTARNRTWLRYVAIVGLVAVVLGVGLVLTRTSAHDAGARFVSASGMAEPAVGPDDAPVTIVEYGDFGCPACQAWHRAGIKDQVIAAYGDRIRFIWRDFPVITPMSPKAAEAAECAHDQGQFWAYHDLLFDRAPAIRVENLRAYAAELGLDTKQFNQCLDSGQHSSTVRQDWNAARSLGLRGTPSFVVNGEALPAPPSFGFLQQVIETKLP